MCRVTLYSCILALIISVSYLVQETEDFHGFEDDEIAIAVSAAAHQKKDIAERFREDISASDNMDIVDIGGAADPVSKNKAIPKRKAIKKSPKGGIKEKRAPLKTPEPEQPRETAPEDVRKTPRRRELERKKATAEDESKPDRAHETAPLKGLLSERLQEILATKKNKGRASPDAETPQEKEIVPKKKAKRSKEEPAVKPSSGSKQLIRPSKLGGFGNTASSATPTVAGSISFGGSGRQLQLPGSAPDSSPSPPSASVAVAPTTPTRLFGTSPSELIVEGKRAWKPSAKVQEKMDAESPAVKQFITQYADAMAKKDNKAKQPQDEGMQKIERILKGES